MLFYLLNGRIDFPLLGYILNFAYYALIAGGVAVGAYVFRSNLLRSGADPLVVRRFIVFSMLAGFALGYTGSRAANIFFYPLVHWSPAFFFKQVACGKQHIFHASIILPILCIIISAPLFGIDRVLVADTLFLSIPAGHGVARFGCFLAGCCWGKKIVLPWNGGNVVFHHPAPLYEIAFNLVLFFLLKRRYDKIYHGEPEGKKDRGIIAAWYLLGYSAARMLIETVRTEQAVFWGMTFAQVSMILFAITGCCIICWIQIRSYILNA